WRSRIGFEPPRSKAIPPDIHSRSVANVITPPDNFKSCAFGWSGLPHATSAPSRACCNPEDFLMPPMTILEIAIVCALFGILALWFGIYLWRQIRDR
ncbi:MAG: hypothetical protein WA728_04810, partial [Xanthobacteraceae bacterium]